MFNRFKPGDRIICIDNINKIDGRPRAHLTINSTYIVIKCEGSYERKEKVIILNDIGVDESYFEFRFILLTEYRKQKLNKICLSQEIA